MGRADHYLIFETAGGFCGIAWNTAGITRFQLPTKSATATERILRHQMPSAKTGAPTPEVAEAVAAVRRYFEGKETDFPCSSSTSASRTHSLSASTPRLDGSDGAAQHLWRPG